MAKQFKELPGWTFEIEEVSAAVYRVHGQNLAGRNVEAKGLDPDALLEHCKKAAAQMSAPAQGGSSRDEE